MQAILLDNRHVHLRNVTQVEEDVVSQHFSLQLDNYRFVDASQMGGWNGIHRWYDSKHQRLARPFLAELRSLCHRQQLPLDVVDKRPPWSYQVLPPEQVGPDFLPGITLEDFQVRAVRTALGVEVGVVVLPTGGGKSEIIAALCKAITCPTVIFADQLVIIDQLKERLELRKVAEEIGLFYAGKTPNGQAIIISSIQSLVTPSKIPEPPNLQDSIQKALKLFSEDGTQVCDQNDPKFKQLVEKLREKAEKKHEATMKGFRSRRKRAKLLQELVQKAEMLICDEADLAVSKAYSSLFRYWFRGRRRYGMTGTPYDKAKPLQNFKLQEHLGSVIINVDRKEVEQAGRIVPATYIMIAFGEDGDKAEGSAFDIAVEEKIVQNQAFHLVVKMVCDAYPSDGTLILVERDFLGEALQALIPGSRFIHGKTRPKRRDEALVAFERRDFNVLIGGKIIKRGLDLRGGCENLVIATGGQLASNLKQQIGRTLRLNKRGRSRVIDFYFLNNRYLYRHSQSRLKAIVELGYESKVIFKNGQTIDGASFISSRFHRPKWKPAKPAIH